MSLMTKIVLPKILKLLSKTSCFFFLFIIVRAILEEHRKKAEESENYTEAETTEKRIADLKAQQKQLSEETHKKQLLDEVFFKITTLNKRN